MENFEEISQLIKEAKPLYFTKKRRNRNLKIIFSVFSIMFISTCFINYGFIENSDYISSLSDSDSVISEMGLPVDDYGFLKVD